MGLGFYLHQTLNSIAEEDESLAASFISGLEATEFPQYNHTQFKGKAWFIDSLVGSDNDEGSGGSDNGTEDLEVEFEIVILSGESGKNKDEYLSMSQ